MKTTGVRVICSQCGKELRGHAGIHGYHVAAHAPLGAAPGAPRNCWGAKRTDHKRKAAR
jgi:hypothetical protein